MLTLVKYGNKKSWYNPNIECVVMYANENESKLDFYNRAILEINDGHVIFLDDYDYLLSLPLKIKGDVIKGYWKYNKIFPPFEPAMFANLRTLGNYIFDIKVLKEINFVKDELLFLINIENSQFEVITEPVCMAVISKQKSLINFAEIDICELRSWLINNQLLNKETNAFLMELANRIDKTLPFNIEETIDELVIDEEFIKLIELDFLKAISFVNNAKLIQIPSYANLPISMPMIDRNKLSIKIKEKSFVVFKPQINVLGGTEYFFDSCASIDQSISINFIGLDDGEQEVELNDNISEALFFDNITMVQQMVFENEFVIFTSADVFAKVRKHIILPKDTTYLFLGDVKDLHTGGIYVIEGMAFRDNNMLFGKVLTLSESNAESCMRLNGHPNIAYIPNFYDFKFANRNVKKENFIYLSRIQKYAKNSFEIIRIAQLAKNKIVIDVYGDGAELASFLQEVKEHGLEKTVVYKGVLKENKIATIAKYKALLVTSTSEGVPTVFLEAMDALTPIICFDSFTSAKDLVDTKNGILVPKVDASLMLEAMYKIDQVNITEDSIMEKANSVTNNHVYTEFRGEK